MHCQQFARQIKQRVGLKMSNFEIRDSFFRMLNGSADIPSHMMIGPDCKHNHGHDGRAIRYAATNYSQKYGRCVICMKQTSSRYWIKKASPENSPEARHEIERRKEEAELSKVASEVWDY